MGREMPEKYEDVLELYGPEPMPGNELELAVLREWTEKDVREKGEEWVRKNSHFLRLEWDYILELGVPGSDYIKES
jgi:hypothetical protein